MDWFYVDALEGGTLGTKAFEDEEPFADRADLMAAQSKVDQRLLALCDGLKSGDLARTAEVHRGTRIQTDRVG